MKKQTKDLSVSRMKNLFSKKIMELNNKIRSRDLDSYKSHDLIMEDQRVKPHSIADCHIAVKAHQDLDVRQNSQRLHKYIDENMQIGEILGNQEKEKITKKFGLSLDQLRPICSQKEARN